MSSDILRSFLENKRLGCIFENKLEQKNLGFSLVRFKTEFKILFEFLNCLENKEVFPS